jgi:hypothetical protein
MRDAWKPKVIVAAWFAFVAFDLWLLLIRPDAPWDMRLAYAVGLLGVYTFAFGLLSATDLLKRLPGLGNDLTSPNPFLFLAGNLWVLSILLQAFRVAVVPLRTREGLDRRGGLAISLLVQLPVATIGLVLGLAALAVYLVVIAPLAWLAYVLVNVPLDMITTSGLDVEIGLTGADAADARPFTIKGLVEEHIVVLRNLLVAVPSLLLSLILDAPGLI